MTCPRCFKDVTPNLNGRCPYCFQPLKRKEPTMKTRVIILTMFASLLTLASGVAFAKDAPKADKPELRDVATCADGKVYQNTTGEHRGACSGHGGVVSWADGTPVKAKGKSHSYR